MQQRANAAELKAVAEQSVQVGKALLELVRPDDQVSEGSPEASSNQTPWERQRQHRREAYANLTAASQNHLASDPHSAATPSPSVSGRVGLRPRTRHQSLPIDLLNQVERLGVLGWEHLNEAETAWQQMIVALRQNVEQVEPEDKRWIPDYRQRSQKPSKLVKTSSSTKQAARPGIIKEPRASSGASRDHSPSKAHRQVRFSDPIDQPKRTWFGLKRRLKA
jgi:hypothetical protein